MFPGRPNPGQSIYAAAEHLSLMVVVLRSLSLSALYRAVRYAETFDKLRSATLDVADSRNLRPLDRHTLSVRESEHERTQLGCRDLADEHS